MIPVIPGAVLAAAIVIAPSVSIEPATGENTDAALSPVSREPTAKPSARTSHGIASWARASLGYRYIASPLPMGTHVRVCGPVGCISGQVTDHWPSWRDGIVSLYEPWFRVACGSSPCWVSVTPSRNGGPQ